MTAPDHVPPGIELRPVEPTEWRAFVDAGELPFHSVPREVDYELFAVRFPYERSLAAFDAGQIVGTAGAFDLRMTVPGGGDVATAGVTAVAVWPTHRRRGILSAIMHRQFADYRATGVPLAALWASEAAIYGRFGYGLASWSLALELPRDARFAAGVPVAGGRIRLADPAEEESRKLIAAVDEATRRDRPGRFARDAEWLRRTVADPEHWRDGYNPLQLVLHEGDDGVDGFALYNVKSHWEGGRPAGRVLVRELQGTDPAVAAALWRYVLDVDLVAQVDARALPLDEPLLGMLVDPRAGRPQLRDNLWVRLVDLPAALAARAYTRPLDVVVEVRDEACPWNAGRWRLSGDESGAVCGPTGDAADLALSSAELAAAYLGGPTLRSLAAAGLVDERRRGMLAAASAAFHHEVAPCCPEVF